MWRVLWILVIAVPATAHPLPNLRYDRTVDVRLTAAGVSVRYTLELNEWSMVLDREVPADRVPPSESRKFAVAYVKKKAVIVADRLIATVNGQPLAFRPEAAPEIHPNLDHLEFRFRFVADWPKDLDRTKPVSFAIDDANFESVSGKLSLTLRGESNLNVIDLIDPGDLRGVSPLDLKPGQEEKLRKASAVFELPRKAVSLPTPEIGPLEPVVAGAKPGLAEDLLGRGLTALFDSEAGVGLLLLAAALFGMAHAFTPGHGKTLVAAYLVGERGTIRHALVLGVTTTLAHTGSVIAIAILLWSLYREGVPESAQGWLQLGGGVLIFLVGLWLLLQRLRGRADHIHIGGGHHHDRQSFGWGRVLLLGLAGGLIPCWDAVMLLLIAISAGRLGFAIPMLLAFSVGLAAVLVGLGIGVVLAHRAGAGRFGDRRWFRALPILSAALLLLMGLWLARDGAALLSRAARG